MKPIEYIKHEKLTWSRWAARIGCSVSHLHEVCHGRKGAQPDFLFRIEDDTEGRVTARSLVGIRRAFLTRRAKPANTAA